MGSKTSMVSCINWRNEFQTLKEKLPQSHSSSKPKHGNFDDLHDSTATKENAPSTIEETKGSPTNAEGSKKQNHHEANSGATDLTTSVAVAAASASAATGNAEDEYLAICLSVKDQTRDLPEWFTHHYHHIGVRRFYVMDDGSDPPLSSRDIDWGIPRPAITFHFQDRATRVHRMQAAFYAQCAEWHGTNHTWMAFIDVDEFLEATSKKETVNDVLKSFDSDDRVGALGVNWKTHTSQGLLKRPESCRKAFTTCLVDTPKELYGGTDDNHHIKSIVKMSLFDSCLNPHKFNLKDGAMTVGENGDVIDSIAWRSPVTRDRIALHHYSVKSKEEYEQKLLRGNGMSNPKNQAYWNHVENDIPQEECNEMAQYNP
ncbi:Glycosyltransferase family 92 protein [Lachnellula hyalina]|uniref:Glycosyltransferase family 92 protein n=1 Tax=Lachnellula hyalina TaxID=1316788 RepID=A0A8H8R1W8_9HELO|nr:Glycosyltransferase family 92 protein [Lachnellula hyalina]TVY26166.1 Glycosyltransferase family 92 protein [Lachnellula hyalina]